jgi:hypothetical protein
VTAVDWVFGSAILLTSPVLGAENVLNFPFWFLSEAMLASFFVTKKSHCPLYQKF